MNPKYSFTLQHIFIAILAGSWCCSLVYAQTTTADTTTADTTSHTTDVQTVTSTRSLCEQKGQDYIEWTPIFTPGEKPNCVHRNFIIFIGCVGGGVVLILLITLISVCVCLCNASSTVAKLDAEFAKAGAVERRPSCYSLPDMEDQPVTVANGLTSNTPAVSATPVQNRENIEMDEYADIGPGNYEEAAAYEEPPAHTMPDRPPGRPVLAAAGLAAAAGAAVAIATDSPTPAKEPAPPPAREPMPPPAREPMPPPAREPVPPPAREQERRPSRQSRAPPDAQNDYDDTVGHNAPNARVATLEGLNMQHFDPAMRDAARHFAAHVDHVDPHVDYFKDFKRPRIGGGATKTAQTNKMRESSIYDQAYST